MTPSGGGSLRVLSMGERSRRASGGIGKWTWLMLILLLISDCVGVWYVGRLQEVLIFQNLRIWAPVIREFAHKNGNFRTIDADGDGVITMREIADALKHKWPESDKAIANSVLLMLQSNFVTVGHRLNSGKDGATSDQYGISLDDLDKLPERSSPKKIQHIEGKEAGREIATNSKYGSG